MTDGLLTVEWIDHHREPQCPPDLSSDIRHPASASAYVAADFAAALDEDGLDIPRWRFRAPPAADAAALLHPVSEGLP